MPTSWPSRTIFILAAIGSAAGLGNLWRFPFLAYEYGGGAFIVAIIVANLLVGIPLLMLEIGLGQKTRQAAPLAFASIKKSFRYLGWFAVLTSFLIVTYYMAVVAWGLNYVVGSFTLAWGSDPENYFFNQLLQLSEVPGELGAFSVPIVLALFVAWIFIYFTVWNGVQSVSRVVKWSATLPFLILALLLIRAITLPGAWMGVEAFLIPVWSSLLDPGLWLAACSQVFFSLSLAGGVMIAYGAYNDTHFEIAGSAVWIAAGNFFISVLSGLVVFGTLGFMAAREGVALAEVASAGPSLVFVVFPQIFSALPAFGALFAVLFFFMLFTLAIDSAFSLVESGAKALHDQLPHIGTKRIALYVALLGSLGSMVFATQGGLYLLDILDHFIVQYALVGIGLAEAIVVGWLWKKENFVSYLDQHSVRDVRLWWGISIRFIIPLFLTLFLLVNLVQELRQPYEEYSWILLGSLALVPFVLVPLLAYLFGRLFPGGR